MSSNSNQRKSKVLGVPFGTASARLRKEILFHLSKKCGMDSCFRCSERIERIEDFSIDHKDSWETSEVPAELFFDIENIAFSHLACNIKAASKPNKKYSDTKERYRVYGKSQKGVERTSRWRGKRLKARIAQ